MAGTFVSIGTRREAAGEEDALDLLVACHARIRSFTQLALALARSEGLTDEAVAESAAAVGRYFSLALPLHVADEDDSMMPRLLRAPGAVALAAPLAQMAREHVEIEASLAALNPVWEQLAAEPHRLDAQRGAFVVLPAFERLILGHLELEEREIFPVLRAQLGPVEMLALKAEFRARRR